MWTISQLKTNAKAAMKKNYWVCVLVAFIAAAVMGFSFSFTFDADTVKNYVTGLTDGSYRLGQTLVADKEAYNESLLTSGLGMISLSTSSLFTVALSLLVINPLEIGFDYFFWKNRFETNPAVGYVARGFSQKYGRNVLAIFLRNLYITLWSLLFIIPGIVKGYSYKCVPYLLAESPNMTQSRAFQLSKAMMKGYKGKAFWLDISFIGWHILNALTCGILSIFYVNPYLRAAQAELYAAVRACAVQNGIVTEEELNA